MKRRPWEVSRRACLKGAGAAIGLPVLEAMMPGMNRAYAAGATPAKPLVFFVVVGGTPDAQFYDNDPNNGVPGSFWPKKTGTDFDLPTLPTLLQPLADLKQDILLINPLHNGIGELGLAPASQGLDHSRSINSLLTAVDPQFVDEPTFSADTSVDQVAAKALKGSTPISSLFLRVGASVPSSAAGDRLSFTGPKSPVPPIMKPSDAFRQLFGQSGLDDKALQRQIAYRKSVLDYVTEETGLLKSKLGKADKDTLDQYLDSVRSLEERISASNGSISQCKTSAAQPDDAASMPDTSKQMLDLITLAFQCDLTRVVVFEILSHMTYFDWLGFPNVNYAVYHDEVQHGATGVRAPGYDAQDPQHRKDAYVNAVKWMVEQFGYLLGKLKQTKTPDGSGTILNNTIAAFTSEISYGNGHSMRYLPVIVGGQGRGAVKTGRYITIPTIDTAAPSKYGQAPGQPIANLWLSMLHAVGVNNPSFGNSTGPLALT